MRPLLLCLFLAACGTAAGQQYDTPPEFPGGNNGLKTYLTEKLKYPEKARTREIAGQVMIGFIVNTKGRVTNVNVIKHVHALLDSEAVRVVRAMPAWKPALKGKTKVQAPVSLPITFELSEPHKKR